MRAELARRSLVNYGANKDLKARLDNDETKGVFKSDLQGMSEEYLRDGCRLLSIPSTGEGCKLLSILSPGDRQSLINNIGRYNAYKNQKIAHDAFHCQMLSDPGTLVQHNLSEKPFEARENV